MKYPIYCVRDTKVGFNPELLVQANEPSAVRGFKFMIDNPNAMQNKFPEDYELYCIGEFDTESGTIDPCNPAKFIVSGGIIVEK